MNGLILSGGQSSRMGREKRLIQYHGKTQEEYLFELLSLYCEKVFVSLNTNQQSDYPYIYDAFHELNSPLVGILSAFQQEPEQAWLVVACDMPFVTQETIQYLIEARDISQKATAFQNPEELFPEPLITIYEPSIYPDLLQAYQQGRKSAMRVLSQQPIKLINAPDPQMLKSINTPAEYEEAIKRK